MESSFSFKGLLFVYDEADLDIKVWQGETYKVSFDDFSGSDFINKFLKYNNELYALVSDGRLLKLEHINTTGEDNWAEVCNTTQDNCDAVIFDDLIYIFTKTHVLIWDGSALTTKVILPSATYYFYCAVSAEDKIFLYGDNTINMILTEYDGDTTFTNKWVDSTHGLSINYGFYNPEGKSLLVEYHGKLYFTYLYDGTDLTLVEYDIFTNLYITVENMDGIEFTATYLLIDKGILYIAAFSLSNVSNVYVHILEDYTEDISFDTGIGSNQDKLWRVESDPILPSAHKSEELVYYPSYSIIGFFKSQTSPIFKYGKRLECYTDLNDVSKFSSVDLKNTVDQICNLLNAYVLIKPENIAEIDRKDLVGRSNKFLTISDVDVYGDMQLNDIQEYINGENNFKRIVISWNNILIGSDSAIIGASKAMNVNEYSVDSFLVNHPINAKNIAENLFDNMYNADGVTFSMEFAPFLRNNKNINFKTISSYLYLGENKEYKIVKVEHKWEQKITILTVVERNIIFKTLEI